MGKRTGWMRSHNNGRIAGDGIMEDDYSESSGCKRWIKHNWSDQRVRFPSDKRDPESLNGPVIIIQEGRKKNADD